MSKRQTLNEWVKALLTAQGKLHQDQIVKEFLTAKEHNEIPQEWTVDSCLRAVRLLAQMKEIHRCGEGIYQIKLEPGKNQSLMTTFVSK